jgi:hypothetical protein
MDRRWIDGGRERAQGCYPGIIRGEMVEGAAIGREEIVHEMERRLTSDLGGLIGSLVSSVSAISYRIKESVSDPVERYLQP